MITRTATVGSPNGLHARPAAVFVRAAEATGHDITISLGDSQADAASLLEVMTLGASYQDEVTLTCEDDAAEASLDELVTLIEENQET